MPEKVLAKILLTVAFVSTLLLFIGIAVVVWDLSFVRVTLLALFLSGLVLIVRYSHKINGTIVVGSVLAVEFLAGLIFYEEVWEFLVAAWNAPSPASWEPAKWALRLIVVFALFLAVLVKISDNWKNRSDSFFGLIYQIIYLVFGWGTLVFIIGAVIGRFCC
jgi:hypothetical protein